MASQQNIGSVERGDTFRRTITLLNGWVVDDFTGGLRCTVKNDTFDPDVEAIASVTLTPDSSGSLTFDSATIGTLRINPVVTDTWTPGIKYWDIQGVVIGSPDDVFTVARGKFRVLADITRSATPS